jgi:hypothetical protein
MSFLLKLSLREQSHVCDIVNPNIATPTSTYTIIGTALVPLHEYMHPHTSQPNNALCPCNGQLSHNCGADATF